MAPTDIESLQAARKRLVLAADADRRTIERELHGGVHQSLVALATTLQLARLAADSDPKAVQELLAEMDRDVRAALDETALLAQRVYPATVELGGLAALLRSAASNAGVRAHVEVGAGSSYPPEVAMTLYLCFLAVLASSRNEGTATIRVLDGEDALTFELDAADDPPRAELDRLQDRVEALGGRLTIEAEAGRGIRLSGSLPLGS